MRLADHCRKKCFFQQEENCYNHATMEVAQILEELAYDMGELPREAIEAAIARQHQITPYLLEILEDAATRIDEVIEHDNYQAHLYAMYLLSQFRETKAFPLILRLISVPGDLPHAILGDVLTEDLSRILASVCGQEISCLQMLVENTSLNEYVRSAALLSLVLLVGCGLYSRDEVVHYFKWLLTEGLEKKPSYIWDSLVSSACELYPQELYPLIHDAFSQGLINSALIDLPTVNAILLQTKEEHLFRLIQKTELIEDTLSEMEKYLCLS